MMAKFVRVMFTHGLGAVAIALACAGPAMAADPFPTRPVRFVVNTVPGGLVDVTTRLVAEKMRATLGQQVIVENRAGGDGLVGIRAVKAAPPDGYTLLATAGTIVIQLTVKQDPGYDLLKDFTGIGPMVRSPLIMVVGAGQPDKTLADFIARAKAARIETECQLRLAAAARQGRCPDAPEVPGPRPEAEPALPERHRLLESHAPDLSCLPQRRCRADAGEDWQPVRERGRRGSRQRGANGAQAHALAGDPSARACKPGPIADRTGARCHAWPPSHSVMF